MNNKISFYPDYFRPFILAMLLSLIFLGCQTPPEPDPALVTDLKQRGTQILKTPNPEVFWIAARSGMGEKTAVRLARSGANKQVKELADLISNAITRRVYIVISGDNSALTRAALTSAVNMQVSKTPGLYLLFIGDKEDESAVRDLGRLLGARIFFDSE